MLDFLTFILSVTVTAEFLRGFLTLLALYQHGFMVGKYISLERIVEQSKETYYEALNKKARKKWHEARLRSDSLV